MADTFITVSDMLTSPSERAAAENPFAALSEVGRIPRDTEAPSQRSQTTSGQETEAPSRERETRRQADTVELSVEDQRRLEDLKAADRNARAHEQAHRAAGGQYIRGGPYYQFERGPDGRLYAVTGEVTIDVSEIADDPAANARKMAQVRRAALAPRDPSPQDRRVAAQASASEARSRTDALRQRFEESRVEEQAPSESRRSEDDRYASRVEPAPGTLINATA